MGFEPESAFATALACGRAPIELANLEHFPLSSAYLCPDCNSVGNCAQQCPACASTFLIALGGVLDREPQERKFAPRTYIRRKSDLKPPARAA